MTIALNLLHTLARRAAQDDGTDPTAEPTSFSPAEDNAFALWNEKSYLDGVFIGAVAFGVHATLFFITLKLLWARPRSTWKDYIWIVYICVLFLISNIGNGTQLKFAQMIWIDNRDYPGGPAVYFVEGSTDLIAVTSNTAYLINTWFQDGLLLYRLWIIFGKRIWAIILPMIVFLTSVALAIILIVMLNQPTMTLWSRLTYPIFTSYWSISIGFNALCTVAIVTRLLIMRNKIGKAIAGPYASISAMLIESAALYTISGTIFIISYALNSPVQNLILPTLAQIQSIAPLLIIMRVAQGQAWSAETAARVNGSTNFGFSSGGSGGRSGRTGQTDTYAMSNGTYDAKNFTRSGGQVSTRVDTVTWQDDQSHEQKVSHVV
ncbi:hypothetical protein BKA62DRAFT_833453 [Auriculariales sp. MPI-PUGE-AT-0066]|nr:hypothetical protein BKA62DRAFT_833453 [Auriculariales sp. MPI-PUGE-AT-0066]